MPTSEPVTPHPGIGVYTQPVAVLQVSVVQALLSLQTIGVWMQAPVAVLQVSVVQASLSLQTTPVQRLTATHVPVAGLQD
jgi:hypothetical protein